MEYAKHSPTPFLGAILNRLVDILFDQKLAWLQCLIAKMDKF